MNYIIKDRESKLYLGAAGYRPSVELGPYTDKWSGTPTEFY